MKLESKHICLECLMLCYYYMRIKLLLEMFRPSVCVCARRGKEPDTSAPGLEREESAHEIN